MRSATTLDLIRLDTLTRVWPLAIMLVGWLVASSAHATDSYVVTGSGGSQTIDEHSVCRVVTNNNTDSILVPTKAADEWHTAANSFLQNLPTNVTEGPCSAACESTGLITSTSNSIRAALGTSIAIDGTRMVSGVPQDFGGGDRRGAAIVFEKSGGSWSETAKLDLGVDATDWDIAGYDVAISGDTIAVGVPEDDDNGSSSGSVAIFTYNGSAWSLQQKITPADGATNDDFGYRIDLDGDTLVVGVLSDDDAGSGSGSVYVFTRSGSTWSQQQKIVAADSYQSDMFGSDVAVEGDTLIIGAAGDDGPGSNLWLGGNSRLGTVYVYTRSGSTWSMQHRFTNPFGTLGGRFGATVALDGDTFLAAAPNYIQTTWNGYIAESSGQIPGVAVYTRSGGTWSQEALIQPAELADGDAFGMKLALTGDSAAIYAQYRNEGTIAGTLYFFERTGTTWDQTNKVTGDDVGSFMIGLAMGPGDILAGVPGDDTTGLDQGAIHQLNAEACAGLTGGACVIDISSPDETILNPSDGASGDQFGGSIAVNEDYTIVGAWRHNSGAGAVYVYDTKTGAELRKLTASDATADDFFGSFVSIEGNIAVIGANGDDDRGSNSGSAYIFDVSTGSQLFKVIGSGVNTADRFGRYSDIDGNRAIIGANGDAYIFDLTTGTQLLRIPDPNGVGGFFGVTVALSGNNAVVGEYWNDDAGNNAGLVFVFDATTGTQLRTLSPADAAANNNFGESIAIDGNIAAIGGSEVAYIFDVTTGNEIRKMTPSISGGTFGEEISISGNYAIVSAHLHSAVGVQSGRAFIYDITTGDEQIIVPSDAGAGQQFGKSVSINGDTFAVGAHWSGTGKAYIFKGTSSSGCGGGSTVCGGPLWGWGRNDHGGLVNLPNGTSTPGIVTLPSGVQPVYVDNGTFTNCIIGDDGEAYCSGWNYAGQIGDGTTTDRTTLTQVTKPTGVNSWKRIEIGYDTTCAIGDNDLLYCWGYNAFGWYGTGGCYGDTNATGTGNLTDREITTPTQVVLPPGVTGWVKSEAIVGVGSDQAARCALADDGQIYCWGWGDDCEIFSGFPHGTLGNGTSENSTTPVQVTLPSGVTSWTGVGAAFNHFCAIANTGRMYCWGTSFANTPELIALPSGVTRFERIESDCGLADNGSIYCAGWNTSAPTGPALPSGVTEYVEYDAGDTVVCAIGDDSNTYCWCQQGTCNSSGELGSGNTTTSSTPVQVVGGKTFKKVSVGSWVGSSSFAIEDTGSCGGGGVSICGGDTAVIKSVTSDVTLNVLNCVLKDVLK